MDNILEYVALILSIIVLFSLGFFIINALRIKVDTKTTEIGRSRGCRKEKLLTFKRNWTDFFWSNSMRFAWITLILLTIIAYGMAIYKRFYVEEGLFISIFFSIIALLFFIFAYRSYTQFPTKAAARLKEFEDKIRAGIHKEISFEGDSIQRYSREIDSMDTDEKVFEFDIEPKKIDFPPFEKRPPKKPVIASRKLDFLVLSREYFSICKSTTPFNLLNPERFPPKKKCAEKSASGECKEYYYSQMKNVIYEDDHIQIILNNDEVIKYKSLKVKGKYKDVLKALKEKLRITERQRLAKIQEHEKFEEIIEKKSKNRNEEVDDSDEEENLE